MFQKTVDKSVEKYVDKFDVRCFELNVQKMLMRYCVKCSKDVDEL